MSFGFKNHAPLVFTMATPKPCLRSALTVTTITASKLRRRERPAAWQRLEREQEPRTVDDEPGDNDRKRGNALEGEIQGNDNGLDHQPRAVSSRLNPCIQCFEVGVNCAAAVVIMALAGKLSTQGPHVAAATWAFWPRRSSSNRHWLAHGIDQQPVKIILQKSANVLEMPDFIGCLQFFAF
jgi:hypothetical protein